MKNFVKLIVFIFLTWFQNQLVFAQQWSGNNNTNDAIGRTGRVGVGTLSPSLSSTLDVVSSLGSAPLRIQGLNSSIINRTLLELVHPQFRWLLQSDANANPEFIIFDEFNQGKFNVFTINRLSGNVGFGLDAIQNIRLALDGNFGQVSSGQFGSLSQGDIRWSALGLSPVPEVGQPSNLSNPYGLRLQWDSDFTIFQLRDQGSDRKDAEIVFGDNTNDRFKVVFIDNAGVRQTLLTLNPNTSNIEANGLLVQEITVDKIQDWPDYVFSETYKLLPLAELESYVKVNGHLPEIPSSSEVEKNGIKLAEMQGKILKKIEEMTLYMIELKKENLSLREKIQSLESVK